MERRSRRGFVGRSARLHLTIGGEVSRAHGRKPTAPRSVLDRVGTLLGDAGGFIDPIFSSGLLLAARAGWRLGKVLAQDGATADLAEWKKQTDHDLTSFFAFIRLWYDGHFIDNLFFSDLRTEPIYRGIISLLAGNTTHPDNAFLALLAQRMGQPQHR